MNARFLQRALAAALVAAVAACAAPQIYHGQLSALDKGLSPAEAVARLKLPPTWTDTATVEGRTFTFQRYALNNGIQTDLYLLAYEKERLVFWGYVAEFRRQPDRDLSAAVGQVLARHPGG